MPRSERRPTGRDAQREETRQRVYETALEEFRRSGMAAADVGKIAAAAGVARGTFYFHFPTREHVLAELERREETPMAGKLSRFTGTGPDLAAVFEKVIRLMLAMERRVGKPLFRELLALHFSPRRLEALPGSDEPAAYPAITLVVRAIEHARDKGEVYAEADALQTAGFSRKPPWNLFSFGDGSSCGHSRRCCSRGPPYAP